MLSAELKHVPAYCEIDLLFCIFIINERLIQSVRVLLR